MRKRNTQQDIPELGTNIAIRDMSSMKLGAVLAKAMKSHGNTATCAHFHLKL